MLEQVLATLGYDTAGENGIVAFVLLTLLIGGGAAWRTGQAQAQSWGALWPVIAYTAALTAAVRFLHYALFSGRLLSSVDFVTDFAVLLALALLGYRARRARHMTEQYPWLFARRGPLGWKAK